MVSAICEGTGPQRPGPGSGLAPSNDRQRLSAGARIAGMTLLLGEVVPADGDCASGVVLDAPR